MMTGNSVWSLIATRPSMKKLPFSPHRRCVGVRVSRDRCEPARETPSGRERRSGARAVLELGRDLVGPPQAVNNAESASAHRRRGVPLCMATPVYEAEMLAKLLE